MRDKSKDDKKPLESFFEILEKEEIVFYLKFSILYWPANDKEYLLKSTVNYDIGKNKVVAIDKLNTSIIQCLQKR